MHTIAIGRASAMPRNRRKVNELNSFTIVSNNCRYDYNFRSRDFSLLLLRFTNGCPNRKNNVPVSA